MYIKFKIHTFSDLLAPLPCLSWKNDTCTISHLQKFLLHMVYSSEILETVQEKMIILWNTMQKFKKNIC